MKKIKFNLSIGLFGCTREAVKTYQDDVTRDQIDYDFKKWAYDQLDAWYEEVED